MFCFYHCPSGDAQRDTALLNAYAYVRSQNAYLFNTRNA